MARKCVSLSQKQQGLAEKILSDVFPEQIIPPTSIHGLLSSLWPFKSETLRTRVEHFAHYGGNIHTK